MCALPQRRESNGHVTYDVHSAAAGLAFNFQVVK